MYVHYTSIKPFKNFWKTILQARWSLMNGEFYQAFKEKNDTKSKWKRKDFLTHSTREALFWYHNQTKTVQKQKTTDHYPHENICKNPQQNISKSNPAIYKHNASRPSGVPSVNARVVKKSINAILPTKSLKKENHLIV